MNLRDAVLVKPLIEKLIVLEMDGRVSMEFAAFAKKILTEVQEFEMKRGGWFEKYGEQVDDQGNWKIKEENEKKFKSALSRAMDKELDIEQFDISNSGLRIAPGDLINLLDAFK